MKALILAAGFGTRLLPYTQTIPKPLFTLISRPVLEHTIEKLVQTGCHEILINTHHLHEQIEEFIRLNRFGKLIKTIHEPVILDTGGAIANAEPFLDEHPFFVINSDIISTIDLLKAYNFHKESDCLITLVLHDFQQFNKVEIDGNSCIQNFETKTKGFAFTGVQILSPEIFTFFPDKKIFSSIEVYRNLCKTKKVKAFVEKEIFWSDIGDKDSYSMTSMLLLAASKFNTDPAKIKNLHLEKLSGEGSDRNWYRVRQSDCSLIISDHGICLPESDELLQVNAFIHIGNHLFSNKVPVPRIYNFDRLSGKVVLEDLGDMHLETVIKKKNSDEFIVKLYKKVIDALIDFSTKGFINFNKEWTCQTQAYSKNLILEKECRYFMEASEFNHIAENALKYELTGLMHRDMQSRNIMVKNQKIYFIDFQGARSGPLQYDLASLLIDPYVNLKSKIRDEILKYTVEKLNLNLSEREHFVQCYKYCSLTRNMQFLGAFSYLSQTKKKKQFEQYIPDAIKCLKKNAADPNIEKNIPEFSKLVRSI